MIKKLSRWECPACYVCPALGKLPASLYVEMHSIRSTLSALTMRDSQNSMHLQNELSQLKDMMVTSNHESNLSSKIEMLQEEIRELKESAKGNSRAEMPSPVKAALETTTVTLPEAMTNIQASLSELSSKVLKIEASVQANEHPPQPNSDSPNSIKPNTSSPNLPKVETPCEPYESYETQVLSPELKNELLKFVEDHRSEFSSADETNSRQLLYFGEYAYRYTGKEHPAKPPPPVLMKVLDAVDPKTGDKRTLLANSCLITCYASGDNHIPMHRDDELTIDPGSHILTVSLGASRKMTFANNDGSQVKSLTLEDSSLLVTSRYAQDFWKHGILPDESASGERVSFTFRQIAPQHINSTILLGDSNTSKVCFGTGAGTLGAWVPGKRVKVGHIEALPDAVELGPYRNIVIHTGINSLNTRYHQRSDTYLIHHLESKCKEYMSVYPRARIHVSLLLPTRLRELNQRVDRFNSAILDMSYQHKNIRIIDNSIFGSYLSDEHGRWNAQEQRPLVSDNLHLGRKGIRLFAMNIKGSVIGRGISQSRVRFNSSQGNYQGAFGRARHHSAPYRPL